MIDLASYRVRIGRFHGRGTRIKSKMDPYRHRSRLTVTGEILLCTTLLLAWGTIIQACLLHDRPTTALLHHSRMPDAPRTSANIAIFLPKWEDRFAMTSRQHSATRGHGGMFGHIVTARIPGAGMTSPVLHFPFTTIPVDGDVHPHPGPNPPPVVPTSTSDPQTQTPQHPPADANDSSSLYELPSIHGPRTRSRSRATMTPGGTATTIATTTTATITTPVVPQSLSASPSASDSADGSTTTDGTSTTTPTGSTSNFSFMADEYQCGSHVSGQPIGGETHAGSTSASVSSYDSTSSYGLLGPQNTLTSSQNNNINFSMADPLSNDSDLLLPSQIPVIDGGQQETSLASTDTSTGPLTSTPAEVPEHSGLTTSDDREYGDEEYSRHRLIDDPQTDSGSDTTLRGNSSSNTVIEQEIIPPVSISESAARSMPPPSNENDLRDVNRESEDEWSDVSGESDMVRCMEGDTEVRKSSEGEMSAASERVSQPQKHRAPTTHTDTREHAASQYSMNANMSSSASAKFCSQFPTESDPDSTSQQSVPNSLHTAPNQSNSYDQSSHSDHKQKESSAEDSGRNRQEYMEMKDHMTYIIQQLNTMTSQMTENQVKMTQNQDETRQALQAGKKEIIKTHAIIDDIHKDIRENYQEIQTNQNATQQAFQTTNTKLAGVEKQMTKTCESLTELKKEIRETKSDVESNKKCLEDTKTEIETTKADIKSLKDEVQQLKRRQDTQDRWQDRQQTYNDRNDTQRDRQEILNRRANVMFYGIPEKIGRGRERTDEVVLNVLGHYMPDGEWKDTDCVTAYRAGRREGGDRARPRPIVATFDKPSDAAFILKHRQGREYMKKDGYGCGQDLSRQQKQTLADIRLDGKTAYYTRGRLVVRDPQYDTRSRSRQDNEERHRHRQNIRVGLTDGTSIDLTFDPFTDQSQPRTGERKSDDDVRTSTTTIGAETNDARQPPPPQSETDNFPQPANRPRDRPAENSATSPQKDSTQPNWPPQPPSDWPHTRDSSNDRNRPNRAGSRPRYPLGQPQNYRRDTPHSFQPTPSPFQPYQPFQAPRSFPPQQQRQQQRQHQSASNPTTYPSHFGQPPSFEQFQQLHNFFTRMNECIPPNQAPNSFRARPPHTNAHPDTGQERQGKEQGAMGPPPPPPPPPPPLPNRKRQDGRGGGGGGWLNTERSMSARESLREDMRERRNSASTGHRDGSGFRGGGMRWAKLGLHGHIAKSGTLSEDIASNSELENAERQKKVKARKAKVGQPTNAATSDDAADNVDESGEEEEEEGVCDEGEEGDAEESESGSEKEVESVSASNDQAQVVGHNKPPHSNQQNNPQSELAKSVEDDEEYVDAPEPRDDIIDPNVSNDSITVTDEYIEVKTPGVQIMEAMQPKPKRKRRLKPRVLNPRESGTGLGTSQDPVQLEASQPAQPPNVKENQTNATDSNYPNTNPASSATEQNPSHAVHTSVSGATNNTENESHVDSQTRPTVGKHPVTGDDVSANSQSEDTFQKMVDRVNTVTAAREVRNEPAHELGATASPFTRPRQFTLTAGGTLRKPGTEDSDLSECSKGKTKKVQNKGKGKKKVPSKTSVKKKNPSTK